MKTTLTTGLASLAALAIFTVATPASAADLPDWRGSMKDTPIHEPQRSCYFLADLGYSWSDEPDVSYVDSSGFDHVEGAAVSFDDAFMVEFGAGCELGYGFRGELAYGVRRDYDLKIVPDPVDPVWTEINSNTLMFNLYYDLATFRGFTPYVGVGAGIAYHDIENVLFNNFTCGGGYPCDNPQFGDEEIDFAWSLMAGFQTQLSRSTSLDVGYRYIDMGSVASQKKDVTGFTANPPLEVDDITAHELKVGLRFDTSRLFGSH